MTGVDSESSIPREWQYQSAFEGADLGCGDLLLDLQFYCRKLPAGTTILVTSRDAGAPRELPAWCRLTKNTLLEARHPYYLIRKGDGS